MNIHAQKPGRPAASLWPLMLTLLLGIAGLLGSHLMKRQALLPDANGQLAAARRMEKVLALLQETVVREGLAFDEEDLNQTGLIGPEWTELTTSLGNPEAKRTALQPDWAALIYRYYQEAGLQPGDTVAAGFSGSFPGLCLASICAANEMGLNVRVIASVGASMHGATRPELNIVRILQLAQQAGAADFSLLAVSAGGDDDQGGGNALYPEAHLVLRKLAGQSGVQVISAATLEASIQERLSLYGEGVRCFINVGGASANTGRGADSVSFPNGLVSRVNRIPDAATRGLVFEYLQKGVPVIHLLNIRGLAERMGLPVDPVPLTKPGQTQVYYQAQQPRWLAAIALALCLTLMLLNAWWKKRTQAEEPPGADASLCRRTSAS